MTHPPETSETRLLPCPFCGGRFVEVKRADPYFAVQCDDCITNGPHRTTEAAAVADWNARAPSSSVSMPVGLLTRLYQVALSAGEHTLGADVERLFPAAPSPPSPEQDPTAAEATSGVMCPNCERPQATQRDWDKPDGEGDHLCWGQDTQACIDATDTVDSLRATITSLRHELEASRVAEGEAMLVVEQQDRDIDRLRAKLEAAEKSKFEMDREHGKMFDKLHDQLRATERELEAARRERDEAQRFIRDDGYRCGVRLLIARAESAEALLAAAIEIVRRINASGVLCEVGCCGDDCACEDARALLSGARREEAR